MSTNTLNSGRDHQQDSDGADFRTKNPGQQHYDSQFSTIASGLGDVEKRGNSIASDRGNNSSSIHNQESMPVSPIKSTATPMTKSQKQDNFTLNRRMLLKLVTSKKLRGKSSLFALLLVLFGGGGFLTVFFSPSLALINMKEVLTENLNEQLHVVDERSSMLLRSKLKDMTTGSCGAIKIKCKFATISDKQVERFKAAGIEVKTTPKEERKFFSGSRGQILEINYIDNDGVTVIKNAADLQHNILNNVAFRAAMLQVHNPLYKSLTDKTALSVMQRLKITRGLAIDGKTDEDKQKSIDKRVSGVESGTDKTIIIKKDENGNEVYTDSDGNTISKEAHDAAKEQSARIEEYSKNGGVSGVLKNAVKGASIVGYMDVACTVYNSFRLVSGLSKVHVEAQAARYAMTTGLTPADASKVGDISEEQLNFVNNKLTTPYQEEQVLDTSKINTPGSASSPALMASTEAGMTATDGPGYRMMYGEAPDLTPRASRFMIGGGSVAMLDGVLQGVAGVVNLGDTNPQKVSEKCGYIQNPVVRFTGLAVGIVAGFGTFGLTTVASIGGSAAIALALPFLEAQAADILAGNVFKGISSVDSGDAIVVGTIALFGNIAKARGLKPLSAAEGMKYTAASQASRSRYVESQQYLARATPLDVSNRYSFLGSIASTIAPIAQRSKASASAAMMNIASVIPTSLSLLTKPAGAARVLDEDYYDKCNDAGYDMLGLGADAFCGVHYGIDEADLKIEPGTIVDFMVANGEIDPDSEYGDPKDNGRDWNYVKYLKECANRTMGWGENSEENEGNGLNCVKPENEGQNRYYRLYTIDKSVDASMDGEEATVADNGKSQDTGISNQGWTFPTISDATIKAGFQTTENPQHDGVDISSAAILGQPVYAARDGKVTARGEKTGIGYWVVIEHMVDGKMLSTVYGNLQAASITVEVGDDVTAGKVIGKVGRGGEDDTAHLHFEVWDGSPVGNRGKAIEPTPIIEASRRRGMIEGATDA